MRILQSSIFRAICAIVFGYLLVIYREQMLHWTTIAFGALFFLSGLISVVAYYAEKRRAVKIADQLSAMSEMREEMATPDARQIQSSLMPAYPIVGIGSMILGVILAVMPTTFIHGMMYVIAAMVILGALSLMFNLVAARRFAVIGWGYWVVPLLLLIIGAWMIIRPDTFATMPFRILGWAMVVYGIIECINTFKIYQCRKAWEKTQVTDAAVVPEAETAEAEEV